MYLMQTNPGQPFAKAEHQYHTAGGGKASGGQTYTAGTTIKPGQEGKKESEEKEPKKTNFKERFFNWINGVLDDDK